MIKDNMPTYMAAVELSKKDYQKVQSIENTRYRNAQLNNIIQSDGSIYQMQIKGSKAQYPPDDAEYGEQERQKICELRRNTIPKMIIGVGVYVDNVCRGFAPNTDAEAVNLSMEMAQEYNSQPKTQHERNRLKLEKKKRESQLLGMRE